MTAVGTWGKVAEVARRQWGVIDNRQLWRCGANRWRVSRWVRDGRLHVLYPGVYAVGHPAIPTEGKLVAALFSGGPGAALSHGTAAWWWELIDDQPRLIDISVPGRRRRAPGIRFHHPRQLDRTWHRRLPITTPGRTVLDLAVTASIGQTRRALAEAEFRGVVVVGNLETMLLRGHPGSATLRAALGRHNPRFALTRSELERRFLELCEAAGLPLPQVNVTVCGFLVDAYWPEQGVVVELDGQAAHRSPAQLERDHERDLVLRTAGLVVCRYTWHQVTRCETRVEADLRAALERGWSRPAPG